MLGELFTYITTHSPIFYFTQSLWRDEAFSILIAEQPLSSFIGKLNFEPPLYYILLHFWIKIFGTSEIAARSLSLTGFFLSAVIIVIWADKLFHKKWLSWFFPVFYATNPMLLYYAFEVRTYGWFTFFAVLSFYAYLEKRWRILCVATILGFYTHTYFILVPFVTVIHFGIVLHKKIFRQPVILLKEQFVHAMTIAGIAIIPWILFIAGQAGQLKNSWYYPVDLQLVRSVLGNVFLAYEGTPWYLWRYTAHLSIILLIFFIIALTGKKNRHRHIFFFLMIFLPLSIVLAISFIKPLYVNRYFLPVTIAEIFLILFAIETIRNPLMQKILAGIWLVFTVSFNIWYPAQHPKVDIRKTVREVDALVQDRDVILVESPLILFETQYYSMHRNKVYLYNPSGSAFPWYVGEAAFSPSRMVNDIPVYPQRAFMLKEDGTFRVAFHVPVTVIQSDTAVIRP